MPLQHGRLNDHINRVFGSRNTSTFWQRLQAWEEDADEALEGVGADYDPYRVPLRDLSIDAREEAIGARSSIFGFDDLFQDMGGNFSVYKPAVEGGVVDGRVVAPQVGFGSFYLPREDFIGATAEEAAAKFAYVTQTININPNVQGASKYTVSGSTMRSRAFLDAGNQLVNMDNIMSGTRLVFDVESPGLDPSKGIWQLSARMMQGGEAVLDADGNERTINLLFRNPNMDGLYGNDFQPFEAFYEALRGGKVDWIDDDDFVGQMTRFLQMAQESDYLVGQNTSFDINMLHHALKGKENASPEFKALVQGLQKQIEGGKVVDTRLFSKAIFGDIKVSQHLTNQDIYTKHSMENILLETSFLDDLAADLGGWAEIRSRIQQGMHHGDIDTWFEDHLFRMQAEVLSGRRTGILTAKTLEDTDLIEKIVEAQSITPFTNGPNGFTPLMNLVHHQRRWDNELIGHSTSSKLRQGGIFNNWADSVLTNKGVMRRKARLANSGYDVVQAAAMEQNLPFAGLSAMERLISTQLGTHATTVGPGNINALRALMGDVVGGTVFSAHEQMNVFRGRNVALPLELIKAAEASQLIDDVSRGTPVLPTKFGAAMESGVNELQTVRLSTIHWGDQKDVAVVADLFQTEDDVERFIKFLRGLGREELERYGISPDMVDEYAAALRRHGREYGVQIGILRGKNNKDVRGVVNLLEDLGYGVDSAQPALRAAVFGIEGQEGVVGTTPVIIDTQDVFTKMKTSILDNTREAAAMANELFSPNLDPSIARSVQMAGQGGEVNRIYSFVDEYLQKAKKIRPKHLGLAAAGLVGYYLFNRQEEREPYNEAYVQQEFEDEQFYERYKAEMGEPVPSNYRVRQSARALDTAGMVQQLDRTKVGHHNMSSDRYSHLFGG